MYREVLCKLYTLYIIYINPYDISSIKYSTGKYKYVFTKKAFILSYIFNLIYLFQHRLVNYWTLNFIIDENKITIPENNNCFIWICIWRTIGCYKLIDIIFFPWFSMTIAHKNLKVTHWQLLLILVYEIIVISL